MKNKTLLNILIAFIYLGGWYYCNSESFDGNGSYETEPSEERKEPPFPTPPAEPTQKFPVHGSIFLSFANI